MQISTNLSEEIASKLAYLQQETNLTAEDVIQTAIERYYQQLQQQKQSANSIERLKQSSFIGCFSGAPNLAENSEAILNEIFE